MKRLRALFILMGFVCALVHAEGPEDPVERVVRAIDSSAYASYLKAITGFESVNLGDGPVTIVDRYSRRELALTRRYLKYQLRSLGFREVTVESFRPMARWASGQNIYVEIKGSEKPDEIVVLGAHYDTTGSGRPGANDNGTGVAAVLSVARAFQKTKVKPKRTIRFVLFDGEEVGMGGSSTHFRNLERQKNKSVVGFINIDMIGYSPSGLPFAGYDARRSPTLEYLVESVNQRLGLDLELDHWKGYSSDNIVGLSYGIPTVAIFEDARDERGREVDYDPTNHSTRDTFDTVNLPYAVMLTKLIAATTSGAGERWEQEVVAQPEEASEAVIVVEEAGASESPQSDAKSGGIWSCVLSVVKAFRFWR